MIITNEDIVSFRATLQQYESETRWQRVLQQAVAEHGLDDPALLARHVVSQTRPGDLEALDNRMDPLDILGHFRRNPQLLIPLGFDEVRVEPEPAALLYAAMDNERQKRSLSDERVSDSPLFTAARQNFEVLLGLRCRASGSGVWLRSGGFDFRAQELVMLDPGGLARRFGLRSILDACEQALLADNHPAAILLPNVWRTPETCPTLELADTTKALLCALKEDSIGLADLTWQQLEDVVAELLRGRGLEVHATSRGRDGGRDIVARGELIPGEPTTLAVEVKHKGKVRLDDVRSRLWANKDFPVVMFATSGLFSAGVVQEKRRPENFLRLLLKDGMALRAWVEEHHSNRRR